jgi:hypothetical protein
MTLTRLSLFALALCGLSLAACGDKDTGDSAEGDTDSDTDADTDSDSDADTDPNYFEPYLMSWGFDGGMVGGQPTEINSSHGAIPPLFYFELYEKEYLDGYDDRYTCLIAFEPTIGQGTSGPDAWFDWTFDLAEAFSNTCENLDPAVYGKDPAAYFGSAQWELTGEPMGEALTAMFMKWTKDKWETEYEPFVFGGQAWADGQQFEGDGDPQVMWGVVWSLDGTDLPDDSELLEVEDIAMGADGFYRLMPVYLWYLQ